MKVSPVICVVPTGDICGEAATWSASVNSVYWADINRFLIHCLNLEDKSVRSFHFDEAVVALSSQADWAHLIISNLFGLPG